jgi:hypothetical protein
MPDDDPVQGQGTPPAAAGPVPVNPPAPAGYPSQPAYYPPGQAYYPAQPAPTYVAPGTVPAAAPAQPAPARTAPPRTYRQETEDTIEKDAEDVQPEILLVSHSGIFYWWPVWAVGYLFGLLTWTHGQEVQIGDTLVRIHPSNNYGVLYFLTVFLVIVISNVAVRGVASLAVVLGLVLAAVLLAYFHVWDQVLGFFGHLSVYLNQGAYFWFSTLVFITWALTTFVFDRFTHWVIKPGQVTREHFWGAGSQSYDTENMTLEKQRNDLFRHWILGLGSGDLRVHTYGAQHEEIFIPNVLFIGFKIHAVQRLIAEKPAEFGRPTIK